MLFYDDYANDTNDLSRDYFAYLFLHNYKVTRPMNSLTEPLAEQVTRIFERMLLYDIQEKRDWHRTGREHFKVRARYHIGLYNTIEMVLPAFPCKSTNPDKVASQLPDGTEYEALSNLAEFCKVVRSVYPLGCRINVVSDGHVFSDCTGVDDLTVTRYNAKLSEMAEQIFCGSIDGKLKFYRLRDLLLPTARAITLFETATSRCSDQEALVSPVRTETREVDRKFRLMLVRIFGPKMKYIEDLIAAVPEHALTTLYRGFSRFMLDDLAAHPDMQSCKSTTARKKLAESAAMEMIRRNQSYSRLVESAMPRHIRLSIHAHNNAGPKFAVKLLSFRPVPDLLAISDADAAEAAKDHLHIPTPWHASLMEIHRKGQPTETVVCKSQVAREFMTRQYVTGKFVKYHERGGRFVVSIHEDGERCLVIR